MVYSTYHSQNVATLERFKALEDQKKNPKMGILRNKILVIYTQKSDGFLDLIRNLFKGLLNVFSRISGRLTIDKKRVKIFKDQVANDQAKIDLKDQEVAQLKKMIEDLNSKITQPVAAPVVPAVVPNQDQTLTAEIAQLKQAIQQLSGKEVKDNKTEFEALQEILNALASKIQPAPAPVQNPNAESLQELKGLVQDLSTKVGQKDSAGAATATSDLTSSFEDLKKLVQELSTKVTQKDSSELDSLKILMQQIEESLKAPKTNEDAALNLLKEISDNLKIKAAVAATATPDDAGKAALETFLKDLQAKVEKLMSGIDQSNSTQFGSFKTIIQEFIETLQKQPSADVAIGSLKTDLGKLKTDLEESNKKIAQALHKSIKEKTAPLADISAAISGKDGVMPNLAGISKAIFEEETGIAANINTLIKYIVECDEQTSQKIESLGTTVSKVVSMLETLDTLASNTNKTLGESIHNETKEPVPVSVRFDELHNTALAVLQIVEKLADNNDSSEEKLLKQLAIRDQEIANLRDVKDAIAQIEKCLKKPQTPIKSEPTATIDHEVVASTLLEKLEPKLSELARNSNPDLKAFLPQIKAYLKETQTPTKAAASATATAPTMDTKAIAAELLEKLENKLKEIVKEIGTKAHEAGLAAIQAGQSAGIPVPPPPPPVPAPKPVVTSRQVVPSTPKTNNAVPKEDKPSLNNDELFAAIKKSSHRRANSVSSGSPTKDAARTGNTLIDKPSTPSKQPISVSNGSETPGVSTPSFHTLKRAVPGSAKAGASKRILSMVNQEVSAVETPTKPSKTAATASTETPGN